MTDTSLTDEVIDEEQTNDQPEPDETAVEPLPYDPIPSQSAASTAPVENLPPRRSNPLLNYLIIAALFLAVGVLLGITLGGNDLDEETVRQAVRDTVQTELAIVMHDVLADMELSGSNIEPATLQALIASAVQDATRQQSLLVGNDPYLGPEDAPVVIVEFSDFLCPFCGRHNEETFPLLIEDYDGLIRYVYRDFPSVGGQNAVESAMAAHCADDQGAFWEYHDLLFEDQDALRVNDIGELQTVLTEYAVALELDREEFTTCLESDKYLPDIIQDASEGQKNGVTGTPGFFINGSFLSGAQPYDVFQSIIDAELQAQGIQPPESSGA